MKSKIAFELVRREFIRAATSNPKFNSAHEAWAVLFEEVDELWDEVKAKHQDQAAMTAEAVQVAAMALRFLHDICENYPTCFRSMPNFQEQAENDCFTCPDRQDCF